jgi:hypothetical protein
MKGNSWVSPTSITSYRHFAKAQARVEQGTTGNFLFQYGTALGLEIDSTVRLFGAVDRGQSVVQIAVPEDDDYPQGPCPEAILPPSPDWSTLRVGGVGDPPLALPKIR